MKRNYRTLVLNADSMPIHVTNWTNAITLIIKDKASQIDFYKNDCLRDGHGREYPIPSVIMLTHYVRRNYRRAPFSKMNVLARDKFTCQYCGEEFKTAELTLDHVVPRSKWKGHGSPTIWTNIVTACLRCNSKKADQPCNDCGMFPINHPTQPGYDEIFFGLHFHNRIEKDWFKWLSVFPSFKDHYANVEGVEWAR
jgi:5-methylcytosine-specific restriction endonuclease McrA